MPNTPVSFNASQVITDAYTDLGVLGQGETLSAYLAQDGLRRLNRLIAQLKLQEFTFPFIARQVFPITTSQNTYTVGPGGDLETQRPQAIEGAGLLLSPSTGSFAITAVSGSSFTVAGDQTGSFPSGSDFDVTGSTANDGSYTIVTAVYGSATVITVAEPVPDATVDGTIEVFGELNSTTERPIALLTDNAFQAIQVKGMTNVQWTQAYYNATYTNDRGTLWLWPKPTTAVNAIVLYLNQQIEGFADLTTAYSFPPGYADLFEYGLALRLAPPSAVGNPTVLGQLQQLYQAAVALVKRGNVKFNDMPTDGAITTQRGSLYNILTGNG